MTSRSPGLSAPEPTEALHRVVVLVAIVVTSLNFAGWIIAGVFFDVDSAFLEAILPGALGGTAWTMHFRRRYRGDLILILAAGGIVAVSTVVTRETSVLAASVSIMAILATAVPFVPYRWGFSYVGVAALLAGLTGVLLADPGEEIFNGSTMATLSAFATLLFTLVHRASTRSEIRYRTMFESIPLAAAVQDWRAVRAAVDDLVQRGITDLGAHFDDHPDELTEIITQVRVVDANDAMVRLVDAPDRSAMIGHWDASRVNDRSWDYLIAQLERFRDGIIRSSRDWESRTYTGHPLWLHMDTYLLPDGLLPDADMLVTASDITSLKSIQAELREMLDAKDQLVASISHELRTPLTAVLGFTEILESNTDLSEAEEANIRKLMLGEARDMADIIEDLLVAARARLGSVTIKPQPIDLAELVALAARTPGTTIDEEIIRNAPVMAVADPTRVSQILRNLVTNSIRHGRDPRRIVVERVNGSAVVEVRDHGDGVAPDLERRIFDPYVSGAESVGLAPSMGLGLWLARSLAEMMDGSLIHERDGDETVFRLTLPAA